MKNLIIFIISCSLLTACEIMPRNTLKDCREQCKGSRKSRACYAFCDSIHKSGRPLDKSLEEYENAPEDSLKKQ